MSWDYWAWITLKYNNKCYRVRDKLFKPVPTPTYNFGEIVKIREKEEEAVITDIMWHYGKQQHYYFVSVRNKIKEILGSRVCAKSGVKQEQ